MIIKCSSMDFAASYSPCNRVDAQQAWLVVAARVLPDGGKPDTACETRGYGMPSEQGERLVGVTGFEPVASAV
jgi:hypothetical protein